MRITPGYPIPFWYRLWDGNPNRFVIAHLTDVYGASIFGSPFSLNYVQRGIYTATGPSMGNIIYVVDYEVYVDEDLTILDRTYLPNSDWLEPDISSGGGGVSRVIVAIPPIKGVLKPHQINGVVSGEVDASAQLTKEKLKGFVTIPKLLGQISSPKFEEIL